MKLNCSVFILMALLGGHSLVAKKAPSVEIVEEMNGFNVPECALYNAEDGALYVSNVEAAPDEYWSDDGKSHITKIQSNVSVNKRWVNSSVNEVLNGIKGLCIIGDYLYFNDNTRLLRCNLSDASGIKVMAEGFGKANDLATDGENLWLSDTKAGKVYRINDQGERHAIPSPKGVNGITFYKGDLFAVSWSEHEVYQLDPKGVLEPRAFGLAHHFKNLDGIEVLDDGTFIVSDFMGNKVSSISPDRLEVSTLMEIESPADIGINRKAGLLYVPLFMKDKLLVYQLSMN